MNAMRTAVALVLTALAVASASAQSADTVLAGMRQALGGQAALAAVESFQLQGKATRVPAVGPAVEQDVRIACQLPDRYVRITRRSRASTSYEGFNRDRPIQRSESSRGAGEFRFGPTDPNHAGALRDRLASVFRDEFARLALPLFGAPPAAVPLELTYAGTEDRDGRKADVVAVSVADGRSFRMFVDAATHLPLAVSWQAVPAIVSTSGSLVVRGPAPEPAEHVMTFDDFRQAGGVVWPHRLREFVGRTLVVDTRIETISINPTLDLAIFQGR